MQVTLSQAITHLSQEDVDRMVASFVDGGSRGRGALAQGQQETAGGVGASGNGGARRHLLSLGRERGGSLAGMNRS